MQLLLLVCIGAAFAVQPHHLEWVGANTNLADPANWIVRLSHFFSFTYFKNK
jgi:hypothetical protein